MRCLRVAAGAGLALAVTVACRGDAGTEPSVLPDASGKWIGEFADVKSVHRLQLSDLTQHDTTVSGAWSAVQTETLSYSSGRLTGTVRMSGEIALVLRSDNVTSCVVHFTITAQVSELLIWGRGSGQSCAGPLRGAKVLLQREEAFGPS